MKLSIITATYNSALSIQRALESLHSQTFQDFEHIVIDGASKDATLKFIQENSPESKIFSEPDMGLYDALNKGVAKASGDIVGFLHSDDVYTNDKVLEDIVNSMTSYGADGVYGDLEYFNQNGIRQRYWSAGEFKPDLLSMGWMPPHPTLFLKSEMYKQIGLFNTNFKISADYEFILRLLSIPELDIAYIQHSLVQMTTGGLSNKSMSNIIRKSREDYKAMKEHGFASPFSVLLRKNLSKLSQFYNR